MGSAYTLGMASWMVYLVSFWFRHSSDGAVSLFKSSRQIWIETAIPFKATVAFLGHSLSSKDKAGREPSRFSP
jgi:hypothetical protein